MPPLETCPPQTLMSAASSGGGKRKQRQTVYIGDSQGETNRAFSRRNRVFILREFIEQALPAPAGSTVLDVAGGKGSLSWLLSNVDDRLDSIVVDPRVTDHTQMVKSVTWLRNNPVEAAKRAVLGLPSFQPLAGLLGRLSPPVAPEPGQCAGVCANASGIEASSEITPPHALATPRHLRLLVDDALVEAVRRALEGGEEADRAWQVYFAEATAKAEAATPLGYAQPSNVELAMGGISAAQHNGDSTSPFKHSAIPLSASEALAAILRTSLVAGLHPDQATEAAIDLAFLLGVPFAIVPCCVFPSQFPDRKLRCGRPVHRYADLLEYLQEKYPCTRVAKLDFKSDTAKHVVLYTLPSDHPPVRSPASPTSSQPPGAAVVTRLCPEAPASSC